MTRRRPPSGARIAGAALLSLGLALAPILPGQEPGFGDIDAPEPTPTPAPDSDPGPSLGPTDLDQLRAAPGAWGLDDAGVYMSDAMAFVDVIRGLGWPLTDEAIGAAIEALPRAPGASQPPADDPPWTDERFDDAGEGVLVRTDRCLSVIDAAGDRGRVLGNEAMTVYNHASGVIAAMDEIHLTPDPPDWARPTVGQSSSHRRIIQRRRPRAAHSPWADDVLYAALDGVMLGMVRSQAALIRRFRFPLRVASPAAGTITVSALVARSPDADSAMRGFLAPLLSRAPDGVDLAGLRLKRYVWVTVTVVPDPRTTIVAGRGYIESYQSHALFWRQVFDPRNVRKDMQRSLALAALVDRHGWQPPGR